MNFYFNQMEPEPHQHEINKSISAHLIMFGVALLICHSIFLVWDTFFCQQLEDCQFAAMVLALVPYTIQDLISPFINFQFEIVL